MLSSIRPGCKVEAHVGPKRVEFIGDRIGIQSEREKRKRTARSTIHGWVVGPGRLTYPKNSWRVLCVRFPSFLQLCILTATYRTYDIYTS